MGVYRYMPAGLRWENKGGFAIYVRYKSNSNEIKILWNTTTEIRIQAPDRDILVVRNTHTAYPFYPAESWDEMICVDPFHHHVYTDEDLPFYMVNYTDYFMEPDGGSRVREKRGRTSGTQVVSDSGGHQIAVGLCDYVDPNQLIDWYNKNIDLGLIIDIPTISATSGMSNFKKLAQLQKKNTDIMLANKRDDLELINIFHGDTPEALKMFRDITEDDRIDRLAVGGLRGANLITTADKIFSTILSGKKYKHYHGLGILSPSMVSLLSYFSRHPQVDLVTTDSSSPIQVAVSGSYYRYHYMEKPMDFAQIGFRGGYCRPSTKNLLTCQCPVCSALKYTDIFAIMGKSILFEVLSYHNLHVALTYTRTVYDSLSSMDFKQARQFLENHFRGKGMQKEVLQSMDYIDCIFQDGLAKAQKKFQYYMNAPLFGDTESALFSDSTERPVKEIRKERIEQILDLYKSGKGKQSKSGGSPCLL